MFHDAPEGWRNAATEPPSIGRRVEITKDKRETAIVAWPPADRKKWPLKRLWWRPLPFERTLNDG